MDVAEMRGVDLFSPYGLLRYAARLAAILTAVVILAFTLVSLSPLDPVTAYLGYDRMQISPEQEQLIIQRWGLDQPAPRRFMAWAGNLLRGDFGLSVIYNEAVISVVMKRFGASLLLMGLAWSLSGILGFVFGVLAGTYRNSWLDKGLRLYAFMLASTPAFWIGMVLLVVFSVSLGWFPVCCAGPIGVPPEAVSGWQRLHHLLLPALTLSIIGVAQIALHTREKMIDVFMSDYALYAAALGEGRLGIAMRHGLRNVLLPAVTLQFASLGELFGGAVLAEQVFAYPGLGRATVEAGTRGDVPLLLGIVFFSTLFVVTGNAMADLLYGVIDPRIRMKAEVA
jgi:peptide/nickel transport system permease protein